MSAQQANEVYLGPILLDPDDLDVEGQFIGDGLHSFTCLCRACEAENDRIDHLIDANRAK